MSTNPNDTAARKLVGKFAKTLLATTCLTVATGGSAWATCGTIYNESADLGLIALAASLDPGCTIVNGSNTSGDSSFFELTGLGSGNYTVTATTVGESGEARLDVANNSSFSPDIVTNDIISSSGLNTAIGSNPIPGSGDLFFDVHPLGEDSNTWSVIVTTTSSATPEPSTVPMMGLGLAGALALGRKLRKR